MQKGYVAGWARKKPALATIMTEASAKSARTPMRRSATTVEMASVFLWFVALAA